VYWLYGLSVGAERRTQKPEDEEERERKERTLPADGSNHVRHGRTRTCKCQVDDEPGTGLMLGHGSVLLTNEMSAWF
jgi:hypothetical protein